MNQQQNPLIKESCDAILDTAKTIHSEEQSRFTQYESKTNIGIALAGVLLGAYLTYLSTFELVSTDLGYIFYTSLFKAVILIFISIGIIYFTKSIKSGDYQQVDLANIVNLDFARSPSTTVVIEIAATYKQVVDKNKEVMKRKVAFYDSGLNYTSWGFIIFVLHFLIEGIYKYVQ